MSGLRRKLQQCIALNNYVEATRQNTDSVILTDAISNGLVDLKAYGKAEVRGEAFASVVAKGKCEQFIEGLPDTYTPLEYIETTGTQYLDTGIIPTINTKAEVKFAPTAITTVGYWGSRVDPYRFCCTTFTSGAQLGIGMTNNTWPVNRTAITLESIYDCVVANGYASINGTEYIETPVTSFEMTGDFYLGLANGNYSKARYYMCKLWENNVLVFNGIPAKNSNDEIGMYDTVSETFFAKSGIDDFVAGSVLPAPSNPINVTCNNGKLVFRDTELPVEYRRLQDIIFDGDTYYVSDYYLAGEDTISFVMNAADQGRNVLGCYSGSSTGNNLSFYISTGSAGNYVRYKDSLYRPVLNNSDVGIDKALSITPTGTVGFATNSTWSPLEFTCTDPFYIGWLANATSPKFNGSFKGAISIANKRDFIPCERVSDGEIGYYDTATQQFLENQSTGTPTTSGYDYSHYSIIAIDGIQETITSLKGGIVFCENLLSIEDNVDTQSILDGVVIRNIGIKVLDGSETGWTKTNNSFSNSDLFSDKKTEKAKLICSHFQYDNGSTTAIPDRCIGCASTSKNVYFRYDNCSTVADWEQYLAQQYTAGTPVYVIYSLATAVTETVASQSLKYGELVVEGSLSNLEVEATAQTVTTPTPENPLDIYCNNGILKTYQIVPAEYTPLDKITNAANTRIRTSIIPDVDDMEFEIRVNHPTTGSWYMLQARYQSSSVYGISGSSSGNTFLGSWSGSNARATNIVRDSTHNYYIKLTVKNGNITLYIKDLTTNEEETVQNSYTYTSLSEPICIFANTAGNTVSAGNELVFAKIYKSGQLVLDCVPASDTNNNVGVYDRVSQTLLVPEMGSVTAGNTIDNIKITVEGNPETLTIKGNNLYNVTKDVNGKYIDANGNIGDESRSCYCDLIPVKPGETYTYSGICRATTGTSNIKRIHGYINGIWNQQIKTVTVNVNTPFSDTFVIPANINGIRISHWYEDENTQVEESPRPTKYCEYLSSDLGVRDLLGIIDYEDIHDVLSGIIIKKMGVKVFDGTETFISGTNGWISEDAITDQSGETYIPYCTHFSGTNTTPTANSNTVRVYHTSGGTPRVYFGLDKTIYKSAAVFKQWLADQYAAGTPVIVIYPLATPVTESVTKQSTNITSNTNVVERNSENVSGLKIEVAYKKLR